MTRANLQGNQGARGRMRCEIGKEAGDDFRAHRAAIEGQHGVALHFGRQGGDFIGGDVGQVGDDEIEGAAGEVLE